MDLIIKRSTFVFAYVRLLAFFTTFKICLLTQRFWQIALIVQNQLQHLTMLANNI